MHLAECKAYTMGLVGLCCWLQGWVECVSFERLLALSAYSQVQPATCSQLRVSTKNAAAAAGAVLKG